MLNDVSSTWRGRKEFFCLLFLPRALSSLVGCYALSTAFNYQSEYTFFQFKSDDRWKTTGKHTFFTRMCSGKFEIRLNNGNFHTYVSDVMLRNRKFVKIVKLRCFLCWVREEGGRNDDRITLLLRLE